MVLFKRAVDLRHYLDTQRQHGRGTGFVPTMGALHDGHLSLVNSAKKNGDIGVCSIFVNPTQFNDPSDFEKYPVTIERDIDLLEAAGTDILFLPSVAEIYPGGPAVTKKYDLGQLGEVLEGKFRPGHFQGVCTVVEKLLRIVEPDNLYLGQKDYQQCMVITRLVELMGWRDRLTIHIAPTLREPDGLAMSSRNRRLPPGQREKANAIYQSLSFIRDHIALHPPAELKRRAAEALSDKQFKVDYVEIADAKTLVTAGPGTDDQKLVALVAAFLGDVRLIDNMLLN